MSRYKVELLAPAGNIESFIGAVNAGADAVYLGGSKFGARAYADNFTTEELLFCIRYVHLFGRKVYLTVNTLMKESEMAELYDYIKPFYEAGLDACIIQDMGVFQYLKNAFPDMELHVSTQMTVTGVYAAKMLKEMGANRIVPARELSLEEICYIKEETGLEMETFIHGAMCYCYSGQCLFSSILGGRSGNRGRCAQPCRLPYRVKINQKTTPECYPLSLKDMCTLEHIEDLLDAGIDSFKIEGRMKKAEFAAGVTAIYRKYIDFKQKNPDKKLKIQKSDLDALTKLYIRSERQDGYYYKQNGADMITLDSPAYSGSDESLLADIRKKYIDTPKKLPISIYASVIQKEKVSVTFLYGELSVTVYGDMAEPAKNMPLSAEQIKKQLQKLGDTQFEAETIEVYTDDTCFYSLKALNELRRQAVLKLEDEIIRANGLPCKRIAEPFPHQVTDSFKKESEKEADGWTIVVSTKEQINALLKYAEYGKLTFKRVYIESDLLSNISQLKKLTDRYNCYIALPYCMRKKDEAQIGKILQSTEEMSFQGFMVRTLEEYAYLKENGYTGRIYTDAGFYIWNKEALRFWQDKVSGVHCPIELNYKELKQVFEEESYEKMVYGHIPMMVTANCLSKTCDKCIHGKESRIAFLSDRYQKQFPVRILCQYCMNIIYNSVPLSLHKDIVKRRTEYDKELLFTIESEEEMLQVLGFFERTDEGVSEDPPYPEYTTGHEKRGVL